VPNSQPKSKKLRSPCTVRGAWPQSTCIPANSFSSAEAAEYAATRGIILADTKFEFGLLPSSEPNGKSQLILIDEVLTPDSSRYWAAATYEEGKPQDSFDKQYLRDWLIANGKKAVDGVSLPADVVEKTEEKYREAKERIMGQGQWA
jgi:phosphoribosylaminoimidazole-succinocarboxamide synthase